MKLAFNTTKFDGTFHLEDKCGSQKSFLVTLSVFKLGPLKIAVVFYVLSGLNELQDRLSYGQCS